MMTKYYQNDIQAELQTSNFTGTLRKWQGKGGKSRNWFSKSQNQILHLNKQMQQDYSVYFVFKIKFDFGEILLRVELQKQMNFEPEMFKKKTQKTKLSR